MPISLSDDGEIEELVSSQPVSQETIAFTEHEKRLYEQAQKQDRMNKLKQISLAISKNPSDMLLEQFKFQALTQDRQLFVP
jgi:hypothetical protein